MIERLDKSGRRIDEMGRVGVHDPATEEELKEFRAARIERGWIPEEPSEEEKILIEQYKRRL